MRERRVGTFTLGICLLLFGILFLCRLFVPSLDYLLILHCWPVILILLGAEILFYVWKAPDAKYRYDFAAIMIILLLAGFAVTMAGVEWITANAPEQLYYNWGIR